MSEKMHLLDFNNGLNLREGVFEQLMTDKGFVNSPHFFSPCLKAFVFYDIMNLGEQFPSLKKLLIIGYSNKIIDMLNRDDDVSLRGQPAAIRAVRGHV
jgi:hypothetical protein